MMENNIVVNVGACPVDVCHDTTASVPVTVNTFAEAGEPSVRCCGTPEIHRGIICGGSTENKYEFTVSQTMRIQIPMFFGADIGIGDATFENCGTTALADNQNCACSCCDSAEPVVQVNEPIEK